jgi:response regulator RpfG family c-di-GMP phosphodiesterase
VDNPSGSGRVLSFENYRARGARSQSPAAAGWYQLRVLVVDDEPAIRSFLCECVEQRTGWRCTGVAQASEALEALRAQSVDVAVVALQKTSSAGLRLAAAMRDAAPEVPVVLTGAGGLENVGEVFRIGVFDYLLHPIDLTVLVDSIARAGAWRRDALHAQGRPDDLLREVSERAARLRETFSLHAGPSIHDLQAALEQLNTNRPVALARVRRVSQLSLAVASTLGVDEPARHAIEQGALLQDLGKAAIPDAVVLKPGPLTADEMAVMRRHTQIGHDIASTVPALRHAAEIILATHERYDGTGYPRGLHGEAIPIGARIIAAVGAFDALTSARVYRTPVSVARANQELVRGAGSQFDPLVVEAWLGIAESMAEEHGAAGRSVLAVNMHSGR